MLRLIHRLFKLDSIVNRFFFWLVFIIILTSFTYLFTYSSVERNQKIEETKKNLEFDLQNQHMVLTSWTEDREQEVQLLASFPVTKERDYEIMGARFRYYSDYFDQIESILYIDPEGYVRINTATEEVILYGSTQNVKEEPFFQMVKNGGNKVHHVIEESLLTSHFSIFFLAPVFSNEGEFNGIVGTVVYPERVIDVLSQTIRGNTGSMTLVDKDGMKILNVGKNTKHLYIFEEERHYVDGTLLHFMRKKENGFLEYKNSDGEKVYAAFTAMEQEQFYLINEITKREVLQTHNRVVALMFVITVLIIMAAFLAFLPISKRLMRPFTYLAEGIGRMKEGDYTIQLDPEKFKTTPKEIRQIMCVFNEMAASIQNNKNILKRLSHTDGLTGVANRRLFDERLDEAWAACTEAEKPLSLIFIDIDHFKQYNDRFGHLEGDACLKKVARAVDALIEEDEQLVARYGGEEFVVILPNTDTKEASSIAKQMQKEVEALRILRSGPEEGQYVTVSIGVATVQPTEEKKKEDLIELADQALYEAKSKGRNKIVVKTERP